MYWPVADLPVVEAPVAAANLTPEMTKLTGIEGRLAAIEKEFGITA